MFTKLHSRSWLECLRTRYKDCVTHLTAEEHFSLICYYDIRTKTKEDIPSECISRASRVSSRQPLGHICRCGSHRKEGLCKSLSHKPVACDLIRSMKGLW
eukprot:XP_001710231.1 Hypothetical protein GL50803_93369 [Giardia lamblia ATCC 50803]